LNHILLFIAVISPLAVMARAWRPGGTYRSWRIASLLVLVITGAAWLIFPDLAGFVGGGAWFALLFLPAVGLRRMAELAAQHRYVAARKLARALLLLHPSDELRRQVQLLRVLESGGGAELPPVQRATLRQDRHRRLSDAPAVLVFISLNLLAFIVELLFGGWNDATLHQLGALEPSLVLRGHEYWRLFTALFLHFGPVHLLLNLFALYILGMPLERSIGSIRFCVCYLVSGIGSTAGVVLLAQLHLIRATFLVGASGAVMGIVGAWAGFLLLHRDAFRARQRLSNVVMIVVVQIVFDLSTPQVSMAAHLCGLVTGFVIGLAISPQRKTS
jgi:membrane associated rhomboid family serine protease